MVGAGGHARVVLDMLVSCDGKLAAVADPVAEVPAAFAGIRHLPSDDDLLRAYGPESCFLLNGVGTVPGPTRGARRGLFERFGGLGYGFLTLVHPSATVSPSVRLGEGVQVMAGAVVQCGCALGRNVIVNTRASVDHDCSIGDHVHVAPGAVLCGGVTVDDDAFVGAGAILLPGARVPAGSLVAAGQVVKPGTSVRT